MDAPAEPFLASPVILMAESFNLSIQEVELVSLFREFSADARSELVFALRGPPSHETERPSHFRCRSQRTAVPRSLSQFGFAV